MYFAINFGWKIIKRKFSVVIDQQTSNFISRNSLKIPSSVVLQEFSTQINAGNFYSYLSLSVCQTQSKFVVLNFPDQHRHFDNMRQPLPEMERLHKRNFLVKIRIARVLLTRKTIEKVTKLLGRCFFCFIEKVSSWYKEWSTAHFHK